MELAPDELFIFNNPYGAADDEELFSAAEVHTIAGARGGMRNVWRGNFFPNMALWDQLEPMFDRGGSGRCGAPGHRRGIAPGHRRCSGS